jgi:hypothetical protein
LAFGAEGFEVAAGRQAIHVVQGVDAGIELLAWDGPRVGDVGEMPLDAATTKEGKL